MVRSTIHRHLSSTKPVLPAGRDTISSTHLAARRAQRTRRLRKAPSAQIRRKRGKRPRANPLHRLPVTSGDARLHLAELQLQDPTLTPNNLGDLLQALVLPRCLCFG